MRTIRLPRMTFENNLPRLLSEFAVADGEDDAVALDFGHVEYWIPAAIVFACSAVNRWREQGREVTFENIQRCRALGYFQRIDFFERAGLRIPENFSRHDPGNSFVEIRQIQPGPARLADPLATSLAECLASSKDRMNDVLRFAEYAIGEVVANCQQHALKPGFAAAQHSPKSECSRVGVADYGIGIRESFRRTGSPHLEGGMTDAEVLEMAMRPWVSSKTHLPKGPYGESANRGVGLKMIRHMVENSLGELFIASGTAWRLYKVNGANQGTLPGGSPIPGTVVSISFHHAQIHDFPGMIAAAQAHVGLTSEDANVIFGP